MRPSPGAASLILPDVAHKPSKPSHRSHESWASATGGGVGEPIAQLGVALQFQAGGYGGKALNLVSKLQAVDLVQSMGGRGSAPGWASASHVTR